jgi:hypothetical protein
MVHQIEVGFIALEPHPQLTTLPPLSMTSLTPCDLNVFASTGNPSDVRAFAAALPDHMAVHLPVNHPSIVPPTDGQNAFRRPAPTTATTRTQTVRVNRDAASNAASFPNRFAASPSTRLRRYVRRLSGFSSAQFYIASRQLLGNVR